MEKRKRWQLVVILLTITLTLYNIMPTVFYYAKPLKSPINEKRADKISLEIATRINGMEQESISWLDSFCTTLSVKPSSITIDKENPQKISILFSTNAEASLFKKYLPKAGALIPFVPAQLTLGDSIYDNPNEVIVLRDISIPIDNTRLFKYVKKFNSEKKPTVEYQNIIYDQFAQIALTLGGVSENASLVKTAIQSDVPEHRIQALLHLASEINQTSYLLEKNPSFQKRFFTSFTQGSFEDQTNTVSKLTAGFQNLRDQLKAQKNSLIEGPDFLERKKLLDSKEASLIRAEMLLKKHKTEFSSGKKPWKFSDLKKIFTETYNEGSLQTINVASKNPFINKIFIDWEQERIFLSLHSDIIHLKKSLSTLEKNRLDQLIINEIARISRMTDEKILPQGQEFVIKTSSLPDSQSLLMLDLNQLADHLSKKTKKEIIDAWNPTAKELKEEFPIWDYSSYQNLSSEEKSLGLLVFSPTEKNLPQNMKSNAIYVVAKGLPRMMQKYQSDSSSEEAKTFFDDFQKLTTLLKQNGFQGFFGSALSPDSEFAHDFIFVKDNFYQSFLKATREDFKASGNKRYATLEFSTLEQRILTQNKIEMQVQEDLLKWKDEYNQAQVSLDPEKKLEVPKPTKNAFTSNIGLSFRKYFRGDEKKVLHWGLDLSGGKAIQIELRDQNNKTVTDEASIKEGINELYNRVNKMGVSDVNIRQEGAHIALDFPGSQALSAQELIKASSMSFHIVNEKFGLKNPSLQHHVNRFLQEVWNEAVVTNRKDSESINLIAYQHLYGDNPNSEIATPRSESAKILYDNGLKLPYRNEVGKSSLFDDSLSKIAVLRGEDSLAWRQSHPLLFVFNNYVLEGSSLDNIRAGYDPSKGNYLSFEVKGSILQKDGQTLNPRSDLHTWTNHFSKDKVMGTLNESYSQGSGFRMAVVLNDTVISSPELSDTLRSNASISGNFSQREVNNLVADLKAGSLTYTPRILSEKNVSPELGYQERMQGIMAIVFAFALVIVSMVGYYRFAGLIASIAVLFNLLIMWATLQNIQATLSLAGIAGIILTVGMAVDANVLVFERIKEEFAKTNRIATAVQAGYSKAFTAIFDSNITTIIAGIILLNFDSGPIKAFAVTLIIGIVSSMFTALFMTKYFFAGWVQNPNNKKLTMMNLIKGADFNFLKVSKFIMLGSISLILVGGYSLYIQRHHMFGMDFTGGYALSIELENKDGTNYKKEVENALITEQIAKLDMQVRELNKPNHLKIFLSSSLDLPGSAFFGLPLQTDTTGEYLYESNPRISYIIDAISKAGLTISKSSLSKVDTTFTAMSGQMSDSMKNNAVYGLLLALFAIMIYITIRFEFTFAASAILCLVHDVLITLATLAIFRFFNMPIQIDLHTVAALMTIIGYSLNDTIIVFDRIREDLNIHRKKSLPEIINHALNVTLSRTTITSATTLIVLIALVAFGGASIFGFALVMLLGVVYGTFSSLFIASPVMLFLHNRQNERTGKLITNN